MLDLMSRGCRVLPIFEEMQANGLTASRSRVQSLYDEMQADMLSIGHRISSQYYFNKPFNPNSQDDVNALLRIRGLTPAKRSKKTGKPSTSKPSIEHYRYTDDAIRDVFEWRERGHIRDSYCQVILDSMDDSPSAPDIQRVSYVLKTTRTTTRRISSEADKRNKVGINILAIPSRTDIGQKLRTCFVAPPGYLIGEWDYSQIEVRYLAHVSGDPTLIKLFLEDRDFHRETAAMVFSVPLSEVTVEQRRAAKTINFGVFYGMSAGALQTQLRKVGILWPLDRCDDTIVSWFDVFHYVKEYNDSVVYTVNKKGYVCDISGKRRDLPEIHSTNPAEFEAAKREAISHTIQGGAQTLIQNAMIYLDDEILSARDSGIDVRWILQYHDALMTLHREEEDEYIDAVMVEGMTRHYDVDMSVPVLVEGHSAKSWGELKG